MAEIATEDGTREEEEEPAAAAAAAAAEEKSADKEGKTGEEETTAGKEGQTSSQSGESTETSVPQMILESDSDTEDEEEEEVMTNSSSTSSARLNQTTPQTQTGVAPPLLSASPAPLPQSASPAASPGVISGITVTEATAPPGTPPSPGRCISVSSPGRGHKIFMVTRVESPPEQQQQQLQFKMAPSKAKEASKKPPPPPSQTHLPQEDVKESSPDCKLTEQSPVAHVNTTLESTEDVTASTLDPEATDPSQQAPALPSAFQLTEEGTESTKSPQPEPTCVEGKTEGEEEEGCIEESKLLDETSIPAGQTQQQPSALEQLQDELASASEESQSPNQSEEEEEEEPLPLQETPVSENEKEDSQLSQEEPCPEPVLSVQTDQQEPSVAQGEAATTESVSTVRDEDSPDESSADEGEVFTEAPEEQEEEEVVGSALPNGLKPEFSLHLLDAESPKPGSCVMEHGE